ncbi:transglycosylase domain-containing protein [Aquabacterium sp. A7-Y]|uniref:penicillin-binding protein 1A n=1 Tax=Aquabacterium sp. A7-Y TaxID=1349605 RepID=UPI00223C980E|nr:transglycosylase domain-containing protein [Aquabacterium sp. A7-Y]MCW7536831.1 transglycosylase domain-containing protein [Aquabacterium sp. A7-Y]
MGTLGAVVLMRLIGYFRTLLGPGLRPPQRALLALRGLGVATLAAALLLAAYAVLLIPFTPAVDNVLKARSERPSVLLAADGSVIATFKRTNREWMALDRVPTHVVDALIATEDHRFWEHAGVDWRRSLAAVVYTLGGERQGGSTITQQLARNFFAEEIGRAPTATRKIKEIITAIKLERRYSKREILEAYLNTVSFHYNAFGIEMAARTYYNKPARELTLVEGATLVGLLKGTRAYNPVSNPQRARERRNLVLTQMVKRGTLGQSACDKLSRRPLRLNFVRQDLETGPAPHFADVVRRWLIGWSELLDYDLYADGLVVQSTLDVRLQRLATQALERRLDALQAVADVEWGRASGKLLSTRMDAYQQARRKIEPFAHFWATRSDLVDAFIRESPEFAKLVDEGSAKDDALAQLRADTAFMAALRERKTRLEAGLVAIDPGNGHVRAWVGGRDFATGSFDHVQQARRQPGSTFKPFVYGAALEAGMDPQREFRDGPVAIRLPNGSVWTPNDAREGHGGRSNFEDGLVHSRNSITAQVMEAVGTRKVVGFAQRLGVRESKLEAVPSLALGTSPVTLLEMASAYASIAALGEYRAPVLVTRVTDASGRLVVQFAPRTEAAREPVLEPDVAIQLIDMLRAVVDQGTGRGIRDAHGIHADVAGKTGTTQNNADGWFVLMHPQLVTGSWVGFNDPRVTLRSDHWGQGAHNALHVVGDFMQRALAEGAIDSQAAFPSRPGRAVQAAIRSAGEALRRLFGWDR